MTAHRKWNNKHNLRSCGAACPVTGGLPSRMTEAAFVRACQAHQARSRSERAETGGKSTVADSMTMRRAMDPCETCRGNSKPAELEIIPLTEVRQITAEKCQKIQPKKQPEKEVECMRKKTSCDCCGKAKALSMCSGDLLCSSCAALAGAMSNRLEDVATMVVKRGKVEDLIGLLVKRSGPEGLMQLVQPYLDQVTTTVENDTLERIAAAVGCQGKDGEELVGIVEDHEAIRLGQAERYRALCKIVGCRPDLADPEQGLEAEIRNIIDTANMRADDCDRAVSLLRRANVAMPDGEMDLEQLPERIAKISGDVDRYRQQAERLSGEVTVLANRVADLEKSQAVEGLVLPSGAELNASALDSHLLDLALDAMRGNITGLDPDRIAVLRDAA